MASVLSAWKQRLWDCVNSLQMISCIITNKISFYLVNLHKLIKPWKTSLTKALFQSPSVSRLVVSNSATVAHQAPLFMEFSRQESLLQGIFLTRVRTQVSCIAGRFFTTESLSKWIKADNYQVSTSVCHFFSNVSFISQNYRYIMKQKKYVQK